MLTASAAFGEADVFTSTSDFPLDTRDYAPEGTAAALTDFTLNTLGTSGQAVSNASNFVLDTRQLEPQRAFAVNEPGNFTIDTRRFPNATLLTVTGRVTDLVGTPVANALLELTQIGLEPVTVVTGAGGFFTASGLLPSAYRVKVSAAFYTSAVFTVDGNQGGTVSRQVQLDAAITLLLPTAKGRLPNSLEALPTQPTGASRLRVWHKQTGVWQDSATLDPALPTVVMTHGWWSDSTKWGSAMAQEMVNRLGMSGWNITAWDWEEAAKSLIPPSDKTPTEGRLLGERLYALLGSGYGKNLHLIGHSLGTLVNRYACDWLHGDSRWQASATAPHVTLLDEAELASIFGVNVLTAPGIGAQQALAQILEELNWTDALNPQNLLTDAAARITLETLGNTVTATIQDWKSPIPASAAYVDNYVSLVGWNRNGSANVCLAAPPADALLVVPAHAYAHKWYRSSLGFLSTVQMGFARSRQAGAAVPPVNKDYQAGSLWRQSSELGRDEMQLTRISESSPGACSDYVLRNIAAAPKRVALNVRKKAVEVTAKAAVKTATAIKNTVVDATQATIKGVKYAGEVVADTVEKTGTYLDAKADQAVDFARDLTADLELAGQTIWSTAKYSIKYALPGNLRAPRSGGEPAGLGVPGAGVWITLTVPKNTAMMIFDFGIVGDPVDDCIVAAVAGKNVFHLPASNLVSGEIQSTDFIDISAYAGQEVEFFFGYTGGTSKAEAIIEGFRFLTVPPPTLAMTTEEPGFVELHWSSAATGWYVEESDSLTDGTWTATTSPEGAEMEAGVLTLKKPIGPETLRKFYRLKLRK